MRTSRGSALLIALLVLALAALVGLGAAEGAAFALRIAGAGAARAELLTDAENALERALAARVPDARQSQRVREVPGPFREVTVTIERDRLADLTPPPLGGYSLGIGRGFGAEHYVARSVASHARGGRAVVEQQFHLLVPESPQ